ncbi:MAG: GatB/YqeY domain-containing protein [Mariprofundaceae bacterium]|nr:GatB/YqeY domain-containing protein [Mariprofundaceae bacterium]
MLEQRITDDMKTAMKARDKKALSAIRMLKSAIKDKQIELGRSPDDQEVMALIGKLVKQRKDAAQQYADAGRADLQASELAEAELYSAYLPEPLTQAEVDAILEAVMQETGASGMKDMGKVMGALGSRVQGRADMGQLSAMVKSRLTGQ